METKKAKIQSTIFKRSMIKNGIKKYVFLARDDKEACPICAELDGKVFNVDEMKVGVNIAPMHQNCRCSFAAASDRAVWEQEMRDLGFYSDEEKRKMKDLLPRETKPVKIKKGLLGRLFKKKAQDTRSFIMVIF